MKKTLIAIALLFAVATVFAQTGETIKFLGIPIDGPYQEFTKELTRKGWKAEPGQRFNGTINGSDRIATVSFHKGKVDRVMVEYAEAVTEKEAIDNFNAKLLEHNENASYIYEYGEIIPGETRLGYDMEVRNKVFDASFFVKGTDNKGRIWFRIEQMGGGYRVVTYYDNLRNRPIKTVL